MKIHWHKKSFTLLQLTVHQILMFLLGLVLGLLLPFIASAQYYDTYTNIATLKTNGQLNTNQVYALLDVGKLEVRASSCSTFYAKPVRCDYSEEFDELQFNFNTRMLTGIDNCLGAIRATSGVWHLINDVAHKPQKLSHCTGNVQVHFGRAYDIVIGGFTSIDETYSASQLGVTCGASIGLSTMTIWVHKTVNGVKTQMSLAEASIAGSNIFVVAKMGKYIQL